MAINVYDLIELPAYQHDIAVGVKFRGVYYIPLPGFDLVSDPAEIIIAFSINAALYPPLGLATIAGIGVVIAPNGSDPPNSIDVMCESTNVMWAFVWHNNGITGEGRQDKLTMNDPLYVNCESTNTMDYIYYRAKLTDIAHQTPLEDHNFEAHTMVCVDLSKPESPLTTLGLKAVDVHVTADDDAYILQPKDPEYVDIFLFPRSLSTDVLINKPLADRRYLCYMAYDYFGGDSFTPTGKEYSDHDKYDNDFYSETLNTMPHFHVAQIGGRSIYDASGEKEIFGWIEPTLYEKLLDNTSWDAVKYEWTVDTTVPANQWSKTTQPEYIQTFPYKLPYMKNYAYINILSDIPGDFYITLTVKSMDKVIGKAKYLLKVIDNYSIFTDTVSVELEADHATAIMTMNVHPTGGDFSTSLKRIVCRTAVDYRGDVYDGTDGLVNYDRGSAIAIVNKKVATDRLHVFRRNINRNTEFTVWILHPDGRALIKTIESALEWFDLDTWRGKYVNIYRTITRRRMCGMIKGARYGAGVIKKTMYLSDGTSEDRIYLFGGLQNSFYADGVLISAHIPYWYMTYTRGSSPENVLSKNGGTASTTSLQTEFHYMGDFVYNPVWIDDPNVSHDRMSYVRSNNYVTYATQRMNIPEDGVAYLAPNSVEMVRLGDISFVHRRVNPVVVDTGEYFILRGGNYFAYADTDWNAIYHTMTDDNTIYPPSACGISTSRWNQGMSNDETLYSFGG